MKTIENVINVKKVNLLISDYTMATDTQEKDLFLSIAGNYIREIQDSEIELIYYRVCEAPNPEEKELYLEILVNLLDARKSTSN